MTNDLQDRVAIITGAGGGLGRAHAHLLARCGAKVVVNDIGDAANKVAAEINAAGGEAISFQASVVDEEKIKSMVMETMERWGRIDILVNNAGNLRDKSFAKMTLDDFRSVLDVHLMGSVICTQAVWEIMRQQKYGRIVFTTSSSGLYGNFGQANYSAAKMGLVGLMQTLSLEGVKNNILVNCLAPTAATAMSDGLLVPQAKRVLQPEAVSPAILPLVSQCAPTRAIVCAGAGHFSRAYITLTGGHFLGSDIDTANRVFSDWQMISDRETEQVPDSATAQIHQELIAAFRSQTTDNQ
ncbi:Putative short-chain type dehydrogenase/reductase Rv0148 [Serratia quinivorans]|jgi:NAD(P)-dependent dehydrogenase (short-subunit alcohol dehydrogenase family)|uniref:SDR family NAD(P)-dependent oxidoreductase n=1 Tax=Serratia TaxID=613 RepID=UPI0021771091|nr:SDR family NAD(P)-dependent oxidoreductase [Serratia quinivorans]CAI0692218.1 Putative short-chain type dehydrogenase/reductase Rv0148 [Serratia quinivorans]CAI0707761.1 Putative short-chain type dehydrogenase/reductase Rv0148 [Serratia quinivorans]CAI0812050.1 Putative short-chain type dehydrogenase/reductase Rv0148 [Serratia quinivorans]CAI0828529.1 Putative short-chain type dehydrogenase/reductase Rv0148 [Serratia quinivorans]CAI0844383.1 Putative short-chain type dehydrogenase/reductase